ncbi:MULTISPECIES: ABC transporter substrate-binding protein [Pseudothermotoga]|uniref:Extracellular solute-binding protein family 1 n=1 Tax=Pseudothermotoga lettingae (strain ATCC BAA-301 / DSM 14385 / NBRC 107922 / TMO) TaxID=416591 RepID=A8F3G9_PSELT|nr:MULTISPECIES: ABC transporter substrate-binding protein [Pseudothermotoga]ABV32703.1 extracellular solute-binding protein family 1 [Pseudothermotoga lettingae TMO]KUK20321.1 MAG: Extracellular solute-binding protein family 1 [Pseudothermotoga lettingae]MDK2885313.1 multiple sugar transport system substrate-binding protein [Pseudothermotoga sp.]GLI48304.1 ABC transporter substrate-binding protein [Pseudothermotoga lettingae TMO]
MRKFLIFVLSTVFILSFAAKIEIVFWTHEDPNRTPLEEKYIQQFEQMYPDVKITRVTYPSAKIREVVLTAFAARKGPDIFNMEIQDAFPYIVNGRVAPINLKAIGLENYDELKNMYIEGTFDAVTYENKIYGLPLELTNWCVFINKKYFKEVGLDPEKDYPKTWEEMVQVSEKIVIKEGQIIKRRGFDFRYPYYLTFFLPMVEQLGGFLFSDDGKEAIINDEAWLKALNFMKQWGPNGKNLGSPTYTPARKEFNKDNNTVAMCLSGLYQIDRIRAENPEFYNSNEWMVVPFPVFENAVREVRCNYYGHYYMVNAESSREKQEWAWKFVNFMLSHPQDYLLNVGLIQPRRDLIESDVFKNYPYAKVFLEDMEKSHIVPLHPKGPQFEQLIREAVESVMLTNTTAEDALKTLKRKANELLKED